MGGSIDNTEIFSQMESMYKVNIVPPLLTGHIASQLLSDEGLLLLTGAALPFKQTAPDMLAYAVAKTATHALALNLAER